MLDTLKFSYKSKLSAIDLNTMDDNMEEAYRHIGMLGGEIYYDWVVKKDLRRYLDKVYLFDNSTGEYTDVTNPARYAKVTPAFPHSLSTWNAPNDMMFYGWNNKFFNLNYTFSANPVNISGSWSWDYWNNNTWTTLSLNGDTTTGWTGDGKIDWLPASVTNWSAVSLNYAMSTTKADNEYRYWIRTSPGQDASATRITRIFKEFRSDTVSIAKELEVKATDSASMYVTVDPGVAVIDGYIVVLPYKTGIAIQAPSVNKWMAAVQIDTNGDIVIDYSPTSVTPIECNPRVNAIKLADIEIDASDTTIVSGSISDVRLVR